MEKLKKHRVWRKKLGNCAVKAWGGENRMQHPASMEREKTYVQASERGDIEKSAVRNEDIYHGCQMERSRRLVYICMTGHVSNA